MVPKILPKEKKITKGQAYKCRSAKCQACSQHKLPVPLHSRKLKTAAASPFPLNFLILPKQVRKKIITLLLLDPEVTVELAAKVI